MKNILASLLALAAISFVPAACLPATTASKVSSTSKFVPDETSYPASQGLYTPIPTALPPKSLDPAPPPTVTDAPTYTFEELYNRTEHFLDQMMYPYNIQQAKTVKSPLFAENVIGRIEQVRSFRGAQESTEWLFNLFANNFLYPDIQGLFGVPLSYDIIKFAGSGNVVAVDTLITVNATLIGIKAPIQMTMFFTFDGKGAVSEWDMTFRYLERSFKYLFFADKAINNFTLIGTGNFFTQSLANSICGVAAEHCTGSLQQYNSTADCITFLTDLDFGAADELGFDTLVCRMVHQALVPSRPAEYCDAIGPKGGNFCSNELELEYVETIEDPLFVNYPFVPFGYANKKALVAAQ